MTRQNHAVVEQQVFPLLPFGSPQEILEAQTLSNAEKRIMLSSWASDRYAVESHPSLREIPGVEDKIDLDDILAALRKLDDDIDPPPSGGASMPRPTSGTRLFAYGARSGFSARHLRRSANAHRSPRAPAFAGRDARTAAASQARTVS